jgi:DNA-binding response OmpR family regulator
MGKKQSVLVVDDSSTVRRLAELALLKGGYEVFTAENGDVGFEIAKREVPSVILVDFIMPKMNGFQLCKKIRADSTLSTVPIVLITSMGKDVGQGFKNKIGISHHLQKPFDSGTLTKTVREVLEQNRTTSHDHSEHTPSAENLRCDLPDDSSSDNVQNTTAQESQPSMNVDSPLSESISTDLKHYLGQELSVLLKGTIIQALKETNLVQSSRRILSGELTYISAADVIKIASMVGMSGKLSVLTNDFNSETYLEKGRISFASISRPGCRTYFEELILRDSKSNQSDILSALCESRGSSLVAGGILLDRGLVSEDELIGYYRQLAEETVRHTFAATSGHFYIEDIPLPPELTRIKPEDRKSILSAEQLESFNKG